jgi:type I restriction enzyme M protein
MKGEFGQFFTPRNIVDFMVKISPIRSGKFNQHSKVLDPCCGSGSFLVHSIMNFREKVKQDKVKWQEFANNSVFGVELNDKISVTAKVNLALHDDGHDNVTCSNGLNTDFKFRDLAENTDLILTNPPFGTKVKSKDYDESEIESYYKSDKELKEFLKFKDYELTRKVFDEVDRIRGKVKKLDVFQTQISSEMLFFELYYRMLKVGGVAQVVIPDGVLTNSTAQFFRNYLIEHFQILGVVSLPQFAFSHYGAGVKSSIIILKKIAIEKTREIKEAKERYLKESVDKIENELSSLEKEKKDLDKTFAEIEGVQKLTKEIKELDKFKDWKKSESDRLTESINDLKESAIEEATNSFKSDSRFQYPIFMAIAENIGYDATGRETGKNDLDEISEKFRKFLENQKDWL